MATETKKTDIRHIIFDEQKRKFVFYSMRERQSYLNWADINTHLRLFAFTKVEGTDKWDVSFKSGETLNFVAEIKIRDRMHDQFSKNNVQTRKVIVEKQNSLKLSDIIENQGWLLEKYKYDCLKEITSSDRAKEKNTIPLFLVFFRDKIVGWNLNNVSEKDFTWKEYRHESVAGDPKTCKKHVAYLQIADAMFIEDFETNKQILNQHTKIAFRMMFPNNPLPDNI